HQRIVDDDREVVGRVTVGADDHRIADDIGLEPHVAAHEVGEDDVGPRRDAKADRGTLAGRDARLRLLDAETAARAGVACRTSGRQRLLSIRLELRGRAEAVVRVLRGQELLRVGLIQMQPLGLAIGTARSPDVRPLVPIEPQPPQIAHDRRLGFARRSADVGVLDPQNEGAALPAGEEPVEQRGPRVAHVELPGRTRGETNSHRLLAVRMSATACAAMASPRPIASTPSLVLPLMLTRSTSMPIALATLARIAAMYGRIFGASRMTVTSTLPTSSPCAVTSATAR